MKNKKLGYAALTIAFLLFNVIALVISANWTSTFWIAFIFTDIAFVAQVMIWKVAFKNAVSLKSKFLGVPIANVGIIYLVVQIIAFAVLASVSNAASWEAVVICAIILAISAICMIAGEVGKNEVNRVETKLEAKTNFLKELKSDIDILAAEESNNEVKQTLIQLADMVRYSDPMSDDSLSKIETEIFEKVVQLKSSEKKLDAIKEIGLLITKRNNKVKVLK